MKSSKLFVCAGLAFGGALIQPVAGQNNGPPATCWVAFDFTDCSGPSFSPPPCHIERVYPPGSFDVCYNAVTASYGYPGTFTYTLTCYYDVCFYNEFDECVLVLASWAGGGINPCTDVTGSLGCETN